jgi:hypothetical protein
VALTCTCVVLMHPWVPSWCPMFPARPGTVLARTTQCSACLAAVLVSAVPSSSLHGRPHVCRRYPRLLDAGADRSSPPMDELTKLRETPTNLLYSLTVKDALDCAGHPLS